MATDKEVYNGNSNFNKVYSSNGIGCDYIDHQIFMMVIYAEVYCLTVQHMTQRFFRRNKKWSLDT